jgi:hypothetical protein
LVFCELHRSGYLNASARFHWGAILNLDRKRGVSVEIPVLDHLEYGLPIEEGDNTNVIGGLRDARYRHVFDKVERKFRAIQLLRQD